MLKLKIVEANILIEHSSNQKQLRLGPSVLREADRSGEFGKQISSILSSCSQIFSRPPNFAETRPLKHIIRS